MIAATMFALRVSPVLVIILAALLGLVLFKKTAQPNSGSNPGGKSNPTRPLLILASVSALAFVALFFMERRLYDLAAVMFRIDLFAFGGGFASVPLMFHEIVEVRSWMDSQTFLNGIALGQITPGPIVITATFVGYLLYGLFGAVVATLSVFLPSFLMVIGLTPFFDRLRHSAYATRALGAVLCSFVGLLLTVTFRFGSNIQWDIHRGLLAAAALVALFLKVQIIWVVLMGTISALFL